MNKPPIAYFITFNCYGKTLPTSTQNTVDRQHNQYDSDYLRADKYSYEYFNKLTKWPPYTLSAERRQIVSDAIKNTCDFFNWKLIALHVRSNHVNLLIGSANEHPNIMMRKFKAYATRALNKAEPNNIEQKKWARHGSTRYIWQSKFVVPTALYILNQQGEKMETYVCERTQERIEMMKQGDYF